MNIHSKNVNHPEKIMEIRINVLMVLYYLSTFPISGERYIVVISSPRDMFFKARSTIRLS